MKISFTNREKETEIIAEQRNAVDKKQAIGAQELAGKGGIDAASVVAKTTGISEHEGVKNVFVAGLLGRAL